MFLDPESFESPPFVFLKKVKAKKLYLTNFKKFFTKEIVNHKQHTTWALYSYTHSEENHTSVTSKIYIQD